jgi:septation ring formation regulator EzrA
MFRSYERSVPYDTMARIIESKNAATRDEKKLCEHTLMATWAYEQLTYKFQRVQENYQLAQNEVNNLESQLKKVKELKKAQAKIPTLAYAKYSFFAPPK